MSKLPNILKISNNIEQIIDSKIIKMKQEIEDNNKLQIRNIVYQEMESLKRSRDDKLVLWANIADKYGSIEEGRIREKIYVNNQRLKDIRIAQDPLKTEEIKEEIKADEELLKQTRKWRQEIKNRLADVKLSLATREVDIEEDAALLEELRKQSFGSQ